jgi:hypothetical protein
MMKIATCLIASLGAVTGVGQSLAETALIETVVPEPGVAVLYVDPDGTAVRAVLADGTPVQRVNLADLAKIDLIESYMLPVDFKTWRKLSTGEMFYCPHWFLTWCWGVEVPEAFEKEFELRFDERGLLKQVVNPDGSVYPNRFFNLAAMPVPNIELLSTHTYRLIAYRKDGKDMLGVLDLSAGP